MFTSKPVICADDCTTALPVVSFSDSCFGSSIVASEINKVYVALAGAKPFTDFSDPAEWAQRLSETASLPAGSGFTVEDLIRPLTVIADKPAPAKTTKDISNGRNVDVTKTHTINITIDEFNKANSDFQRQLVCAGKFRIWYQTKGGLIFGGNEGILCQLTLDTVLGRGDTEIITIAGTAVWKSIYTEEFAVSPLAAAA